MSSAMPAQTAVAYLVVRCFNPSCGASATFDPETLFGPRRNLWPSEAVAGRRFRCRCGAREAEASYSTQAAATSSSGVYLFG